MNRPPLRYYAVAYISDVLARQEVNIDRERYTTAKEARKHRTGPEEFVVKIIEVKFPQKHRTVRKPNE